jgi:hypothetical protein
VASAAVIARIAAVYGMTVGQLLEHGLGHDPEVQSELDRDPPAALLAALELRTGIAAERAAQMCVAGWIPWLLDSVQAHRTASTPTYASSRCCSGPVLDPGTGLSGGGPG